MPVIGVFGGSVIKNLPGNAGDAGSVPGSGRSPGEENNNPLQYSCLGNPMDRGAWWTIAHGVTKESNMTQRLKQEQLPSSPTQPQLSGMTVIDSHTASGEDRLILELHLKLHFISSLTVKIFSKCPAL